MKRQITGFHQDEERHWVAELECGHGQHVRHDPPWQNRPWVATEEGRRQYLGVELDCKRCDAEGPEDYDKDAYDDARIRGLCHDGAVEFARRRK
jgi:hypothetical protein